ncbi:hypothetical protein [Rosistilla oblonga]|uniref:hypothetical protein n=1 Tax=Rosistilla oblonga TaxID=2527990 RepID=UPI003A97B663
MVASPRTTAQQNSDSQGGYRSLAGYVFQLLGAVAEAVHLVRIAPDASVIEGTITLEAFGQDSFVCLVPETNQSRFTQYKHSLSGDEIQPDELRDILEKFVASVKLAELEISECQFVLATNRDPADWTKDLLSTQEQYKSDPSVENEAGLEKQLWKKRRKDRPKCANEMLEIFKKLEWQAIDEESMKTTAASRAYELGVPSRDVDQQIQNTLGLFLDRVNSKSYRTIFRRELDDALAGHPNARPLRCDEARTDQRRVIEHALDRIHHKKPIVRRGMVNDIATAFLAVPLVLVVGDGGRGKSAVAWQSLLEQLHQEDQAPDFVTGFHFGEFTENTLVNEFARWRNRAPDSDGPTLSNALARLSAGCQHSKLLVLYIDGIDEKEGQAKPYPANQRFIERLLQDIVHARSDERQKQISLVVSCRTIDEANWLTRIVGQENFKPIPVDEFSDQELEELAMKLAEPTRNILLPLVSQGQISRRRFNEVADERLLGPLREPRVWASFFDLEPALQVEYLSGSCEGRSHLAEKYLRRIEEKAAERLAINLGQNVVTSILEAAGEIAIENESEICTQSQWIEICHREHFSRPSALSLFDEFVTAGLLNMESENGKHWSWKQLWLRESLCGQEVVR